MREDTEYISHIREQFPEYCQPEEMLECEGILIHTTNRESRPSGMTIHHLLQASCSLTICHGFLRLLAFILLPFSMTSIASKGSTLWSDSNVFRVICSFSLAKHAKNAERFGVSLLEEPGVLREKSNPDAPRKRSISARLCVLGDLA